MSDFWRAVLFLHLLSMAFFVGGQLVFGAAVVPLLRGEGDREPLRAIARRFGYGSVAALGVLIVTGWAMASHLDLWDSSALPGQAQPAVIVSRANLPLASSGSPSG